MISPSSSLLAVKRARRHVAVWLPLGLGVGGVAGVFSYPFALNKTYAKQRDDVTLMDALAAPSPAQRQRGLKTQLRQQYLGKGTTTIDWYTFADMVDTIAQRSASDAEFQEDVWRLFGWQKNGERGEFAPLLDNTNTGLPARYHNTGYAQEQIHHYLGAVTGNRHANVPSHLLNNPVYSRLYKLKELATTGRWNQGDVALTNAARQHRDDFVRYGRGVVAQNIRQLLHADLAPRQWQWWVTRGPKCRTVTNGLPPRCK